MPHDKTMRSKGVTADVDGVALWALSKLAEDIGLSGASPSKVTDLFVDELYNAAAAIERRPLQQVVDKMLAADVTPYEIADIIVPRVAALLGDAWCEDRIGFATTTIGSARLQGVLRNLGPEWCAEDVHIGSMAPRFLVLVPEGAQHTLGATILVGQLRRTGLAAQLAVDVSPQEISERLSHDRFDAVFISASARESLEVIRHIVQKIHEVGRDVPVVVGGNVLSLTEDIAQLTGADLATSDLSDAIRHCVPDARRLRGMAAE